MARTQAEASRITRARKLRQDATSAEILLWQRLRAKQIGQLRFRRQQPIGPFIADFFCPACHLVIELDGVSHEVEEAAQRDAARQDYLQKQGLTILRFYNAEIYSNLEGVIETICAACQGCKSPSPGPSREGRGGS